MENTSYIGNGQDILDNPWKGLSIKDKSDIMRIAIDNGITDLHSIRQEYNEFASGGNIYNEGGHVYDELPQLLKDAGLDIKVTSGYRKARYAGDKSWHIHHGAVDIIPQGKTTFEDIENAVYSNPGIYNYMLSNGLGILDETGRTKSSRDTMKKTRATGAHFHFGKDSIPAKAFADRMSSLWDSRMEGLRQNIETPLTGLQAVPDFIPSNPQAFFNPYNYQTPTVLEPVQPSTSVEDGYSQEALDRQEKAEGLKRLGMVMNILNPSGDNSIVNTLAMLSGNQFKGGGNIHIKPENRGKFTALKKRTGHSATWFKEHGTPAQKKMAVFALNSRKWKHGLGGNLYDGNTMPFQQMQTGKDYWAQVANKPTWLDTFIAPVNGGQLPEIVVKPTNDANWLFSLGEYSYNGRRPLADSYTRKVVANYLSKFDNENAKEYNARISRLAEAISDTNGTQFQKNDRKNKRAYYNPNNDIAKIDDMNDVFSELAHPYQSWLGNNKLGDELSEKYNNDKDPRGGTRYAYPDTFEGETHGFFEPALREWIETGNIGRSLPIINSNLSREKIVPKNREEVTDSAASWNRQAIDRRILADPHQLPLNKRIQYGIWGYPLLNKKKALGGHIYDGI